MSTDTDSTAPRLVAWDPRWKPPVVDCECPSCGIRATRTASSWMHTAGGTLTARFTCSRIGTPSPSCWRVFDITIPDTPNESAREIE